MLELDDKRWQQLHGGYRMPFDASGLLSRLEAGEDVWDEAWAELHHQGDVGEASYASVPHLVRIAQAEAVRDWNVYALVAIIEIERHRAGNPALPDWLLPGYEAAWRDIAALALRDLGSAGDSCTVRSALSVVAIARGQLQLGALLGQLDESEIAELAEERLAWSEVYD